MYQIFKKIINERSALHYAVEKGNLEIIQLLVNKGIDTNIKDEIIRKI